MKTTKGGKVMNPTDAYRKEIRKRELKRNKKERKKVREVGILKKDPEQIRDQIQKLEVMKAEGALDKARKHKKRQLEDTLNLVLKKRKEYEDKVKEKGEAPVMFSHLGPPPRRRTAEEEDMVKHPKPEDSVYYHPTLNPTGAPPPGKPPMFKSSIGPRIPLSEASTSGVASSSVPEEDGGGLPTTSLPPTSPPALLHPSNNAESVDASIMPQSLPLPPPPPMPPKPAVSDLNTSLPPPPFPPPPPGPPPKEHAGTHSSLPPPPARQPTIQLPPPPGIVGNEPGRGHSEKTEEPVSMEISKGSSMLPPPPPPPGLLLRSQGSSSENDSKTPAGTEDMLRMAPPPPPPPPRQQQPFVPGSAMIPPLQPDVLPPGISRFPPPPPATDMGLPPPGIVGQHPLPPHPGVMVVPLIPKLPYGLPPMMRPPLPPGPPPMPLPSQKPSYIKSAASTVVKRPLAQHTPELTAMVPASVRVKRESTLPKSKPKASTTIVVSNHHQPTFSREISKQESSRSTQPKPPSIDDSYMAFLEDMKALGALDGGN
ncbi:unnamed protein product [Cuscuta europaea]|uniref:Wbp11/ELF5/Saf1 N-terminal domain-containing protein n=1 Tax=Cuscuta europaea TaxID=41803 RepID=A0A9P1E4W8_CUSEU|nr:unnamed protein product [Cuscuta europaea]